ncbi:ECF RNA polymerase sigma factor RpoE [Maioricimonas rarisocia]|uniref:ECF RNA polymerase sigma factor RpoE n=1 Tax=Maioricimonas rarisocia TaxID=2528026 RepID=A0A517ZE12_9PLAN|nr:RNA polymerase sigma factor [Maioricimonas rarisocia]QDU40718.1 ECF RNA polymerase sigma factor RpoE [Maioricimonas rarisocia]
MPIEGDRRSDETVLGALYEQQAHRLQAFLTGILRDPELAREAVQSTFRKALESAGNVRPESLKAWLFQVAYNEALALRRRQGIEAKSLRRLSWIHRSDPPGAEEQMILEESFERVRAALQKLPQEQARVVRLRIEQDWTFARIAEELDVPLGTVLTRMRLALQKLRKQLEAPE